MFDPTSRYARVETATLRITDERGRERLIAFVRRRFIPDTCSGVILAEHIVVEGDRLDRISAAYLGDPLQFWRLADANRVLRPEELTAEPGQAICITLANS